MSATAPRYRLSVGEPWDFAGPDGPNQAWVVLLGKVQGPRLPYWQHTYLLLRVEQPFELDRERVTQLVAAPRYEGDSVDRVARAGGDVGVFRVRLGSELAPGSQFQAEQVEYCIIGTLHPDAGTP
jgi:hypothetical protein